MIRRTNNDWRLSIVRLGELESKAMCKSAASDIFPFPLFSAYGKFPYGETLTAEVS